MHVDLGLRGAAGSFLSEGMRAYLRSLPPERGVDPDGLEDATRVIAEDFAIPLSCRAPAIPGRSAL